MSVPDELGSTDHQEKSLPVTAVFGANGFIGKNIYTAFSAENPSTIPVEGLRGANRGFDLSKPDISALNLSSACVTHAIIAAAVSRVRACESSPEMTRAINVRGTVDLARQLSAEGIKPILLSSDYVFDGKKGNYDESSPLNPLNEYGRQKAEMENLIPRVTANGIWLILRLSKIFDLAPGSGTLLDEIASKFTKGMEIRAGADQVFCPTFIGDFIRVLRALILADSSGLINVCSPEKISRYELVMKMAHIFQAPPGLVKRISIDDLGENFKRPKDTSMVSKRLEEFYSGGFKSLDECYSALREKYVKGEDEKAL